MGRYTTVQAYSDNNPKLVHVSYDQAKAKDAPESGAAGGKLVTEKTDQVMGSCAGAGSGEFHTYRAHRRREMHRVAEMEEEMKKDEATTKLLAAIEKGNQECEERTRKKAEKRKRKKRAGKKGQNEHPAKQAKASSAQKSEASSTSSASSSRDNGDDDVEEFVYIPVADRAASGGDGGAPAAFKNDGSFLEKITAELEAGSNHELKSSSSAVQASGGAAATK